MQFKNTVNKKIFRPAQNSLGCVSCLFSIWKGMAGTKNKHSFLFFFSFISAKSQISACTHPSNEMQPQLQLWLVLTPFYRLAGARHSQSLLLEMIRWLVSPFMIKTDFVWLPYSLVVLQILLTQRLEEDRSADSGCPWSPLQSLWGHD